MNETTTYWMMQGGVRLGPMTFDELVRQLSSPTTPVWRNGLADWCAAENLPELNGFFRTGPSMNNTYSTNQFAQGWGAQHPDNLKQEAMPSTYLAWSIVAMLLCCIPTGIVALIYSSRVRSKWNAGDYAGAQQASSNAQIWIIISIVCGLIALPFQVVLALL